MQLLAGQPPPVAAVYRKQSEFRERARDLLHAACASSDLAPHLCAFYSRKLLTQGRRWPQGSTPAERRLERLAALLRRLQLALVRHELRAQMSGVPALLPEDEARAHLLSLCTDDADRAWLAALPAPLALPPPAFLHAAALPADARLTFNPARAAYVLPDDEPAPPDALLFAALARAFAAAHDRLAAPAAAAPEARERPLTQLAVSLQRRAVQNAARCRLLALPRVQLLLRYAAELLRLSGLLLDALSALPLPEQLVHWRASPAALLLPPLLPSLLALDFLPPTPPAAAAAAADAGLLTFSVLALPLQRLVPGLARLLSASPEAARWAEEDAARGREVWAPVEVESAHPYAAGADEAHHVHVPGAAYLLVAFDARCATEKGDAVQLFRQPARQEPLGVPFSGPRAQDWPPGGVLVEGDRVTLAFTAGPYASAALFGFRATVRPLPFDAPRGPLYDLLAAAALLAAKALALLLHEPRAPADEAPLDAHLALVGPPPAPPAPAAWAHDLAELRPASPAADAWARRTASTAPAAPSPLERVERLAAAALAHYAHTPTLSAPLLRAARQVRDWCASQRQRWAEAGEADAVVSAAESRAQLLLAAAPPPQAVPHERVVAFLCLALRPSQWYALTARRAARARNRAHAFTAFAALARLPGAPHLAALLAGPLAAALSEATHPLAGVRGTGAEERAAAAAWSELAHTVAPLLAGPLVPLVCLAWRADDLALLHELRVLPALTARLADAAIPDAERERAEHAVRHVALRPADAPTALHAWLVPHAADVLLAPRLALADSDAEAERVAFFAASLLLLLAPHPAAAPLIVTPASVALALRLEQARSPRLKRVGVRLLTLLAAALPPDTLGGAALCEGLFARLAALLGEERWAELDAHDARYDHAADVAAFLRFAAGLPAWHAHVAALVGPPLALLSASPLPQAQAGGVLAALSVLGGTLERLRPGARVEVSGDKAAESAVLVAFDPERALARVAPAAAPAAVAQCERTRLSVQLSPPPCAALFPEERLVLLAHFLLRLPALPPPPPTTLAAAAAPASLPALASPVPPRAAPPPRREWDCDQCTLHNAASALFCAVCDAPAPAPAAAPALSRPSTPQPKAAASLSLSVSSSSVPVPAAPAAAPPSLAEVVAAQLGWRVALALCHGLSLAAPPLLASLARSGLLASLAHWSARAGPLVEPRPLHALCHAHDAALDRLVDAVARTSALYAQPTPPALERPTDALLASPFRGAELLLPTCLHRGSARHARFPHASLLDVRARSGPPACGVVRADHPVPASLPVYYFEATLEGGVAAAIGLWREGVPLDGLPGDAASFALAAASGTRHHGDVAEPYAEGAAAGDTLGCLLDQRRHTITFALNGVLLAPAFSGVHARLVPALWLLAPDTLVRVNFGQRPFRLDLAPLLPPDAVPRAPSRAPLSEAQLRREAMAEELRAMMGDSFPLALCSTALERSRDAMDAAAAWLLERGYAEMDRVARELLAQTETEHLDAVKRLSLQEQQRARSPAPHADAPGSGVDLAASVEEDAEAEAEADEEARAAARLLDDQLGLDRPLLAQEGPPAAAPPPPLRLSELQDGALVVAAGRVARLVAVDYDAETVRVLTVDRASGICAARALPAAALRRAPPALLVAPDALGALHADVCWQGEALALQSVRQALLQALAAGAGPLDVAVVGGAPRFAQLLKLLSAELLAARAPDAPAAAAARDARRPFEQLRARLAAALAAASPAELAGMPPHLQLTRGEAAPRWCGDEAALLPVLVEECVAHVVRAVEVPPPFEVLESAHPYANHTALRRKLHVPGAAALLVRFDARSHVHAADALTSLALFRDAAHTQPIAAIRGAAAADPQAWAPVVVAGDTLHVRFTSGAGATYWGFRLTVVPLLLHASDATALASGNFPLALWLFSLLLDAPPAAASARYVPELYRALLFFVRHARRAAKGAGLQLLTRLLAHMRSAPPAEPVVTPADVAVFRRLLERRQEAEGARAAGRAQPYSPRLQALAELLAAAELAITAHAPLPAPTLPAAPVPLRRLAPRLLVLDAELAARADAEGGVLRIASAPRRLVVSYRVLHELLPGAALDAADAAVARGQSRVVAPDQLEPVTCVAAAAAALVAHRPLPFRIAAAALLRSAHAALPFVRLVGAQQALSPPATLWAPPPLDAFTVSLWVHVAPDAPAQARRLLAREAAPAWAVSLDAQRRVVAAAHGVTITSRAPLPPGAVHVALHVDASLVALFVAGAAEGERRVAAPRVSATPGAVLVLGEPARPGVHVSDARLYARLEPPAALARAPAPDEPEALLAPAQLAPLVELLPRLTLPLLHDAAALLQAAPPPADHALAALYPRLAPLTAAQRGLACEAVRALNELVGQVLPLVDLAQHAQAWSLAAQLAQLKGAVLFATKAAYLDALLQATATRAPRPAVTVSRPRALKVRERGGDAAAKHSVFGQLFRALHFAAPEALRQSGVTWSVTYAGEGGTDAGGLFRDSLSHVCAELQDAHLLPLLVPAPNARSRVGPCQERWLVRAAADSALHLDMFAFLGKLLGIALRGRHSLPLDLHPHVWRALVGAAAPADALEELDASLARSLEALEAHADEASFALLFPELTWTLAAPDGATVELCPGGAARLVLFAERAAYVAACRAHLLHYGRAQLDAMRTGLATIVPLPLLVLFTPGELELACCGSADVSLELLRENTRYSDGVAEADQSVQWLWRMLAAFTTKQRQQFLRFVWGRSRLPLRSAHFEQKFVVLPSPRNTDLTLPASRTCFFQLELPRYSSYEVMVAKFLYAITEGIAIDADHRAADLNWDAPLDDAERHTAPDADADADGAGNEGNEGDDGEPRDEAQDDNDNPDEQNAW